MPASRSIRFTTVYPVIAGLHLAVRTGGGKREDDARSGDHGLAPLSGPGDSHEVARITWLLADSAVAYEAEGDNSWER